MSKGTGDRFVEIGVVGRPHGVDGKIRIYLHNPESTALLDCSRVFLDTGTGPVPRCISRLQESTHCLAGSVDGCSSRNDAENLRGAKILVSREDLPDLEDGEFYVDDLIGLEGWDGDRLLGQVVASRVQGDVEAVTVKNAEFELGIPMVDDYVVRVDLASGRILFRDTDLLPRDTLRKQSRTENTE